MPKRNADFADSSTTSEPWVDPDDAPEFTDELVDKFFASAEIREGNKLIRAGKPPLGELFKEAITIRLDPDVIEAYRALGSDWENQINADLRKARKLKKA